MKILITILLMLTGIMSIAQTRPVILPSPNAPQGYYKIGWVQADSGLIAAKRDTTGFLPRFSGTIVMRPQNRNLYMYDSVALAWKRILFEGDVASVALPNTQLFVGTGPGYTGSNNLTFTNPAPDTYQLNIGTAASANIGVIALGGSASFGRINFLGGPGEIVGADFMNYRTTPTGPGHRFYVNNNELSVQIFGTKKVSVLDTFNIANISLKGIDTTDLKVAVLDASGNMFKMNWPSTGGVGGINNTNIGSGFRLLNNPTTQTLRTLFADVTGKWDSTSNASGLTYKVDTTLIATKTDVNNVLPPQSGSPYKFLRTNTPGVVSWQFPLEWVDIRTFGAVGDSITDCTVAIQDAINSLPATGGTILIPDGKWKVSGKITVNKAVFFRGSSGPIRSYQTGPHSAVLGEGRCAIYYTADSDTCFLVQRNATQFEEISILYAGSNNSRTCVGIYYDSATDMRMSNVGLLNFNINMEVENGFQWLVDKCAFIDHGTVGVKIADSLLRDAGDMSIMNSFFNVNTAKGNNSTHIYWRSGGGLRVINNKFNGAGAGNYPRYAIYSPFIGTVDFLCNGNSFENFTQSAIYFQPPATIQTASFVINNNQFTSYFAKVTPDIVLDGTLALAFQNVNISNNVFLGNNNDTAISTKNISDLQISGNQMRMYSRNVYNNGVGANINIVPPINQQTLTFGATTTWNVQKGSTGVLTLTGNTSISLLETSNGMRLKLIVSQDGTGGRTISFPGFDIIGNANAINTLPSATTIIDAIIFNSSTMIVTNTARSYPGSPLVYNNGITYDNRFSFDLLNGRIGFFTPNGATSNPTHQLTLNKDGDATDAGVLFEQHNNANQSFRQYFRKSFGTRSSPSVPSAGGFLGQIIYQSYDGGAYINGASFGAIQDSLPVTGKSPMGFYIATGRSNMDEPIVNAGGAGAIRLYINKDGGIGINNSNTYTPYRLFVNGSIASNKDSTPIVASITSERVLLQDSITGQFKRIAASAFSGGTPSLTSTQIGFGNGSNLLSGSSAFTYDATTVRQTNTGAEHWITSSSALSATSGGKLYLLTSNSPTTNTDQIGAIFFGYNNAGTVSTGASIRAYVPSAWTAPGTVPTRLDFYTANTTEALRMSILNNGNVAIGTTSASGLLTLAAGTTGRAAITLTSGPDHSSPAAGMIFFGSSRLAFVPTGTTPKRFPLMNDVTPTAGGILQGNGTDFTLLALGTAGQQPRVNAGGTAVEWFTPSAGVNIYNSDGTLSGQRIVSGASNSLFLGDPSSKLNFLTVNAANDVVINSDDQIRLNGGLWLKETIATDANFAATSNMTEIFLPAITADRTLTLFTVPSGQILYFYNDNNSANSWLLGNNVYDAAGNQLTKLNNKTHYVIQGITGVASRWQVVSKSGPLQIITSSASTLTLDVFTDMYVASGTSQTFTLPSSSVFFGTPTFSIKNRGTNALTISRGGSDQIYDTGAVTSINVAAGAAVVLTWDGTYWELN